MRRNGYLGTSSQKSDPAICSGDHDFLKLDAFPLPSDVYWIYSMYMCFCVAWPCDLDLSTLRVSHMQWRSCPTHIPIFIILRLLVTELCVLNILSHFRVTWPVTEGKNSPHFWKPWPKFTFHNLPYKSLCHFYGATTKIKNSVFPLWRLQSLMRMRSITWPVDWRSPKTTLNNFLTPNHLFNIQLLWGYDDE